MSISDELQNQVSEKRTKPPRDEVVVDNETHKIVDLFTHKAEIKRLFDTCLFDAIDGVVAKIKSLPVKKQPANIDGDYMFVLSIFDVHFGKLAWAPEAGDDYDLKIADQVYRQAVSDLLAKAKGRKVGKILFPIGSDFLHFDNTNHTTTKGTIIEFDGRWPKVLQVACEAIIWAVSEAAKVAPTEVMYIGGNHDKMTSYVACMLVAKMFADHPHVDVERSLDPFPRQYRKWGKTAIGVTHGDGAKIKDLPLIMSRECSFWSECTTHEVLTGHLHHEVVHEKVGIVARILPSLSGTDAWHAHSGWVKNNRAAMGLMYEKETGIDSIYYAHAKMTNSN